jgi:hypothetical protein
VPDDRIKIEYATPPAPAQAGDENFNLDVDRRSAGRKLADTVVVLMSFVLVLLALGWIAIRLFDVVM